MRTLLSVFYILLYFNSRSQSINIDSVITKASLEFTVSALAHDSMRGRYTAMPEARVAAAFIAAHFEKAGLKSLPGKDKFFNHYPLKFEKKGDTSLVQAINVVGTIRGIEIPDTLVVFCAHYDHIGVEKTILRIGSDSIYNGANDNASGVALLIELAKYYATLKTNKYTLLFAAFSGEEEDLLGSAYAASHMDQSLIRAVINFDMVGRPVNKSKKKCMVVAEQPKPIIKKLNEQLNNQKAFFINDYYPEENMFSRSDHYSFNKVKNKVFFTTSSPYDQYYHTLKDEINTIDFDFLLLTTKNIATACKMFLQ